MPLGTMHDVLAAAEKGKYAVGAFGVQNLETAKACIDAAVAERSPIMLLVSDGAIKYAGLEALMDCIKAYAAKAPVPVVPHLDHGPSFDRATQCVLAGMKSVMVDASHYAYDENVAITKAVVQMAHAVGVTVEGEIGRIGGVEEEIAVSSAEATMTDPEEAARFAKDTGVDALAVAIGNAHGIYHGEPNLDIPRMGRIYQAVKAVTPNTYLVLHGGSGTPAHMIKGAIDAGVSKINIGTEIKLAFIDGVKEALAKNPAVDDPRHLLKPAIDRVKQVTVEKIRLFGSAGRV